jgi:sugar lactone lactonase YvrE
MKHVERINALNCMVGESPLWSAQESAWYWVDIPAKTIWRQKDGSSMPRSWNTSEMVACIALCEDGSLIAGMETGMFKLTLGDAPHVQEQKLAGPAELGPGMRFNDGRCDRQGRFWSGTMFMDMAAARPDGHLYRYTAQDGLSAPVVSGLLVQNGLAWSPDGRTMYLSDSHPLRQLIWAFDYDTATGVPSNQRVFVDMNEHPGRPDGAAIDVEGGYWICANDAGCILRFTPDGKLDQRIDVPMAKPAMCAFGGHDMSTLLIASISAGQPKDATWAGAVVSVRPGIAGVPETRFKG